MKKLLITLLAAAICLSALPVCAQADAPRLDSLSLDGGYTVNFSPATLEYTVFLPSGRPRIPRISATAAAGLEVRIYNAALADGENDGYGYVTVSTGTTASGTDASASTTYRIRFVRTAALGCHLQYDDVVEFNHGLEGAVTFASDSAALTVSDKGIVTAKAVSDTPATVTATAADGKTATLRVDRIVPAQLDLVMSVGQSNAYGSGGNAALAERVRPGTAYDMGYDGNTQAANSNTRPIALASSAGTGTAVPGVRAAFANEWYATTGEKILFINAADPGINIAAWQSSGAAYVGAKKEYERVVSLISDSQNFEIFRRFFYFNHGSADAGKNFNAAYHERVTATFNNLLDELGFEFGTIFEYFSSDRAYTSWIRSQYNRIVSEMGRIYMGCEMKPYICADPSLINSDNLHLSQAGHNLCGRLLAQNTAAQALAPDCKYPGSLSAGQDGAQTSAPSLSSPATLGWDFDGTLAPTSGDVTLSLGGGAERYDAAGALSFADGESWYSLSSPVRLTTATDWMIEFSLRLDGDSKQFAVLGSPDNSAQVYVNLSDGTTKGFKVRFGTPDAEGTAITLSVRDVNDFYTMNTWRLYYRAELGLLYLWRGGELQSTELLYGPMTLSQIGRTGDITTAGKLATLDSLRFRYDRAATGNYRFGFENTLAEDNGLLSLTANGGSYAAESVQLKYASSNLSFDKITLDAAADWSFEVRGSFTKNTGVLASADGSNTIFANVSDPGFRVRTSSSSYVKLTVGAGDFRETHTWRIDYSASAGTVTLYRDGAKVASKSMRSTLSFTNSGTSGSTGASNSALIDYISLTQSGINRGGGDNITFSFNNTLTDDSGSYTMTVVKGAANFVEGDFGYVLDPATRLTLAEPITLDSDFSLSFRARFDGEGEMLGGFLRVGADGFGFAGAKLALAKPELLRSPGDWKFEYTAGAAGADGSVTLTCPDGSRVTVSVAPVSVASVSVAPGAMSFGTLGGAAMTIYSLSLDIADGKVPANRASASVSEANGALRATVASDIWDAATVVVRYQWLRDGHVIPGACADIYVPTPDDVGHALSVCAIFSGTPERAVSDSVKVNSSSEVLPTPPEPGPDTPSDTTSPTDTSPVTPADTSPVAPSDVTTAQDSPDTTQAEPRRGCGSSASGAAIAVLAAAAVTAATASAATVKKKTAAPTDRAKKRKAR